MKYLNSHRKHTFACLAICLFFALSASPAPAQEEPTAPLSRKLAAHLISEFYEILKTDVQIAWILEGKSNRRNFEAKYGAEVTFLVTVIDEGRRRRMVRSLSFHHDKELGWFLSSLDDKGNHEFIDICSEHKGRIRLK